VNCLLRLGLICGHCPPVKVDNVAPAIDENAVSCLLRLGLVCGQCPPYWLGTRVRLCFVCIGAVLTASKKTQSRLLQEVGFVVVMVTDVNPQHGSLGDDWDLVRRF
jgi:hypothetical protein